MNDRDLRFADEYLVDFHPKHAAIRAGFSENTARNAASWINPAKPAKPALRRLIDRRLAEMSRRTGVTAERVMKELAAIAFANADDIIDPRDGGFLEDVKRADMAAVAGYKVKDGKIQEREIQFYDKLKALELIGKRLGMFTDNIQVNGPVPVIVDDIGDEPEVEVKEKKIGFALEAVSRSSV